MWWFKQLVWSAPPAPRVSEVRLACLASKNLGPSGRGGTNQESGGGLWVTLFFIFYQDCKEHNNHTELSFWNVSQRAATELCPLPGSDSLPTTEVIVPKPLGPCWGKEPGNAAGCWFSRTLHTRAEQSVSPEAFSPAHTLTKALPSTYRFLGSFSITKRRYQLLKRTKK